MSKTLDDGFIIDNDGGFAIDDSDVAIPPKPIKETVKK